MTISERRNFDLKVRAGGVALLLLAAAFVALLPRHGAGSPTLTQVGIALVAVCSGSVGACFLFEGAVLFEESPDPIARDADGRRDHA